MSEKRRSLPTFCVVLGLVVVLSGVSSANWSETFDNMTFDQVWTWGCYPDVTKTFTQAIIDGPGDDDYLGIDEATKFDTDVGSYGSAFGIGFCIHEKFTDVRVGTVVNVAGDSASFYHGMGARAGYFVDPDGSITGEAPGLVANAYVMHINWEDWPATLSIDIEKVIWNQNMMSSGFDVLVPGLDNGGSFYAALDVVGSNPAYVTGYLYEHKGGPLVARTQTLVDTSAQDSWEDPPIPEIPGAEEAPFADGYSGIFGQNERSSPEGYHTRFDTVSSISDGPAAACLSPVDGATGVDVDADLEWVEAAFATSRELWFGKEGAMMKMSPAGTTYDPGMLEFGQKYQWKVVEIGPGGTVEGPVCTFTTEGSSDGCLLVDDFESYSDVFALQLVWPDNIDIGGYDYTFVETGEVYVGDQAMRFEYQNQYEPYLTTATRTFETAQDWTRGGLTTLSLFFRGEDDNLEQKFSVILEDSTGGSHESPNPHSYAPLTEVWQQWDIELTEFSDGGVNLAQVKKVIIKTGDGTDSGQPDEDKDTLYIDDIRLCPPECTLTSRGDVDGDCRIDLKDFCIMAGDWLSEGP